MEDGTKKMVISKVITAIIVFLGTLADIFFK